MSLSVPNVTETVVLKREDMKIDLIKLFIQSD